MPTTRRCAISVALAEHLLQFAALIHLHHDVGAADELAVERARLDWLESPAGMDWQWQAGITRATIDAKMQKDAK